MYVHLLYDDDGIFTMNITGYDHYSSVNNEISILRSHLSTGLYIILTLALIVSSVSIDQIICVYNLSNIIDYNIRYSIIPFVFVFLEI